MKYVAFLDILGFSNVVNALNHEALQGYYRRLLTISHVSLNPVGRNSGDIRINSIVVSDSIIYWTDTDSWEAFINILAATGYLILAGMCSYKPIRGCIVRENFTCEIGHIANSKKINQLAGIYGKALTQAFYRERDQLWAGCTVDDSAIEHAKALFPLNFEELLQALLLFYPVPFKGGAKDSYAINWPKLNQTPLSEETVRNSFCYDWGTRKTTPIESLQDEVKIKMKNTIEFLKYSQK